MPQKYRVTLSDGRTFDVTTDGAPPSEADVLSSLGEPPPDTNKTEGKTPGSGLGVMASALQGAKDLGVGFAKGAAHTALDTASLERMVPGVATVTDAIGNAIGGAYAKMRYGTATPPISGDAAMQQADLAAAYSNPTQMAGGLAETAAELAMPVGEAAKAIPTTTKAGSKFQSVMARAAAEPVDISAPGQVALRINELAERGGSMPMAVRKFLTRITDPDKGDLTYQEARDFASNISRLSANEYGRLTPVVGREVANLRVELNKAVAAAATRVGRGQEYAQAMNEYARAMRVRNVYDDVIAGAKKTLPWVTAVGAGQYLANKLKDVIGE